MMSEVMEWFNTWMYGNNKQHEQQKIKKTQNTEYKDFEKEYDAFMNDLKETTAKKRTTRKGKKRLNANLAMA